jgi:hypothetical protein
MLLLAMYVLCISVVVVLWVIVAYVKLVVVSVVRMKLDAVSVVYVRLVEELLVHIVNVCFVALSFADCSFDYNFVLIIESSPGHVFVLTSLLVPASLG